MELTESPNSRDARIEELWKKLDLENQGELDFYSLKKGLARIDHPLKNADGLLQDIIKAMDRNGDEKIQYEEFRTFVEKTEAELLTLFQSIDRDRNGKLDKPELKLAIQKAGLTVSNRKLDHFFTELDEDCDGLIDFVEWRNFLLFIPTNTQTNIRAVMSFYTSTVTLNAEGDTAIGQESLEGLGEYPTFFMMFFGSLVKIAQPPKRRAHICTTKLSSTSTHDTLVQSTRQNYLTTGPLNSSLPQTIDSGKKQIANDNFTDEAMLTAILPDSGYFVAGAISGVVSRTATAPLDRMKVYLIANVGPARVSLVAAKDGAPITTVKRLGQPLIEAYKALWKVGGFRSLFAGNGLNTVKVMPESAIKFGSFEAAKRAFASLEGHNEPQNINGFSKFICGGVAGGVSQLFVYPIDTLKFRMQCETVEGGLQGNALIIATAKKMYAQGPLRTSYRGLTMGLLGMFPYAAIDLGTFEYLKERLIRRNARIMGCHEDDAIPNSLTLGFIGAFSGTVGASIVYPINVVRTRLQAQGTVLHPPTYNGIWDVTHTTIINEGIRGLFKGITPNLLKVVPAVSITYMVYESCKKVLHLK